MTKIPLLICLCSAWIMAQPESYVQVDFQWGDWSWTMAQSVDKVDSVSSNQGVCKPKEGRSRCWKTEVRTLGMGNDSMMELKFHGADHYGFATDWTQKLKIPRGKILWVQNNGALYSARWVNSREFKQLNPNPENLSGWFRPFIGKGVLALINAPAHTRWEGELHFWSATTDTSELINEAVFSRILDNVAFDIAEQLNRKQYRFDSLSKPMSAVLRYDRGQVDLQGPWRAQTIVVDSAILSWWKRSAQSLSFEAQMNFNPSYPIDAKDLEARILPFNVENIKVNSTKIKDLIALQLMASKGNDLEYTVTQSGCARSQQIWVDLHLDSLDKVGGMNLSPISDCPVLKSSLEALIQSWDFAGVHRIEKGLGRKLSDLNGVEIRFPVEVRVREGRSLR